MCDTFIALRNSTKDESTIFGKNSDRLGNEAQLITYAPRTKHAQGGELKCTHISIPQVSETAAVLLSQPYWIWGAEIGANEYEVVIGNEAVATKEPLKETGLIGMDLVRLGLERGKTAKDSLNIIIELLEKYGQGGAHNKKGLNYHNSMIIANLNDAYVLEMAGEWWIVEIVKDYRSISNSISIRGKGDIRKEGIIDHAIEKGYCKDDNDFDFKMIFSSSPLPDIFPLNSRDGCSLNQLAQNKGNISTGLMMEFLREHAVGICMHGRNDQSTGSQVSLLRENSRNVHWFTGNTIPCLGIFKPYVFPVEGQNFLEPGPYSEIDQNWFWSKHTEFIKPFKRLPKKENPDRESYYKKLRAIEKNLISQVDEIILQDDNLSEDDFVKRIHTINQEAWKKSIEMIK